MNSNTRHFFGYGVLFILSIAAICSLLHLGSLTFDDAATVQAASALAKKSTDANPLFLTLLSLTMIIAVSRVVGSLFKAIGQPQVMGEVVGGILLGPSFLSTLAPQFVNTVLSPESMPFLGVISQIGVLLYMFVIGLELDLAGIRRTGHAALAISHASIVLPCLLGIGLAFYIFPTHAPLGVPFTGFALFIGVAMSITAFPVLARILADKGLNCTPLGSLALTCAAVNDATAWCLLALVVGVLQSTVDAAVTTIALTILFVVIMLTVVRGIFDRLVPWIERSNENISETSMAVVLLCLLIAALATELIGVHAIFGGFLLGAVIPSKSRLAADLTMRLEDLVRIFFLPAFFAFTGLRTEISLLNSVEDWLICGAVVAVATAGKFGGAFLAAKLSGMSGRESTAIGILMNTRGLVELIVLNVGLDLGVISPRLFTAMVVMAMVTTLLTGPVLDALKLSRAPN